MNPTVVVRPCARATGGKSAARPPAAATAPASRKNRRREIPRCPLMILLLSRLGVNRRQRLRTGQASPSWRRAIIMQVARLQTPIPPVTDGSRKGLGAESSLTHARSLPSAAQNDIGPRREPRTTATPFDRWCTSRDHAKDGPWFRAAARARRARGEGTRGGGGGGGGGGPGEAQLGPAAADLLVGAPAHLGAAGELLEVAVLLAGVGEGLAAVGALLGGVLGGIQPGGPGVPEEGDVLGGGTAQRSRAGRTRWPGSPP